MGLGVMFGPSARLQNMWRATMGVCSPRVGAENGGVKPRNRCDATGWKEACCNVPSFEKEKRQKKKANESFYFSLTFVTSTYATVFSSPFLIFLVATKNLWLPSLHGRKIEADPSAFGSQL